MQQSTRNDEAEDWSDENYVAQWVARQEERGDERRRQFSLIRALIPRQADEPFRLLELAAGDGALAQVLLESFPNAHATLVDGAAGMVKRARARLEPFGPRA